VNPREFLQHMFAWMEIDAAEEVASGYDGVL
jgi:hypothetical protein